MKENYIHIGKENMSIKQFINKVQNYDVELTRGEIIKVINEAEENNPADVLTILNTIKQTYHINMAF